MAATHKIESDGSLRLPPEALAALGAEPGDDVRLFIDTRRKSVRIERHSDDPWADAMKDRPSHDMEDLFAQQKRREAEADDIFQNRLRKSKKEDDCEKPGGDADKWH